MLGNILICNFNKYTAIACIYEVILFKGKLTMERTHFLNNGVVFV